MARLFIGNRRYSSWSLRGWLAVMLAGLDVEVVVLPMQAGVTPAIKAGTPAGLVPYLEHDGARVWESLALCEYCAEVGAPLWPADRVARAHARSVAAEMHAGFRALRVAMPMNLGRPDYAGLGLAEDALADLARVDALWGETRAAFGGGGPFFVWGGFWRGGCDVCSGGGAVFDVCAGVVGWGAGLLLSGPAAPFGECLVCGGGFGAGGVVVGKV